MIFMVLWSLTNFFYIIKYILVGQLPRMNGKIFQVIILMGMWVRFGMGSTQPRGDNWVDFGGDTCSAH